MSHRDSKGPASTQALPLSPSYLLVRRVGNQALLWLFLGAVVGACSSAPPRNTVSVVSGMIAGMIVLPFLGAILGLIGGRVKDTLIGSACGVLVGALAALVVGGGNPAARADFGLIEGALVGATFPCLVCLVPGKGLSKLRP